MFPGSEKILEYAAGVYARYSELEELLAAPEIAADAKLYAGLVEEWKRLKPTAEKYSEYRELTALLSETDDGSAERRELNREAERALYDMVIPDSAAGTVTLTARHFGGSPRFVREYLNAILSAAGAAGASCEVVRKDIEKCSLKAAEIKISGAGSGLFLHESGIHRFMDERDRGQVKAVACRLKDDVPAFDERDALFTFTHSDGAGGQNVNKVATAVRAKHVPTGITVLCREERSQLQNKRRALERLRQKVEEYYALVSERANEEIYAAAEAGDRIRTYDLKNGTVRDSRLADGEFPIAGSLLPVLNALNTAKGAIH